MPVSPFVGTVLSKLISRIGASLHRFSMRWVPDPFVLALLLTAAVLGIGVAKTALGQGELSAIPLAWIDGVSLPGGLAFALQMCFVLVTGHAMALSPPVQRFIAKIAKIPNSAGAAAALVSLTACLCALVHWGLGAIVGALLAREIGRNARENGLAIHYPLLGAAAYCGMAVWHGGLSGSAPLKVAGGDGAAYTGEISLYELLLSPTNLLVTSSLLLSIPLLMWAMTPAEECEYVAAPNSLAPPSAPQSQPMDAGALGWLQDSLWPGRVVGVLGLLLMMVVLWTGQRKLQINTVNILFFFAGIALQGSLRRYMETVSDGAKGAGAIIVQFPLYFGILGIMKVSGLIAWLSASFIQISNATSFPTLTYLSAGLVNLFVPSGGGQWGVQRDILLGAGQSLQVDPVVTVMAFSYGDAWTNMLQPFWALPLLGIMGLKAKDIIGYTAMVFLLMGLLVPLGLFLTS